MTTKTRGLKSKQRRRQVALALLHRKAAKQGLNEQEMLAVTVLAHRVENPHYRRPGGYNG